MNRRGKAEVRIALSDHQRGLIEDNLALARRWAFKRVGPRDPDLVEQVATDALIEASRTFNPDRSPSFQHYLHKCVAWAPLYDDGATRQPRRRLILLSGCDLDRFASSEKEDDQELLVERVLASLSAEQSRLLRLYFGIGSSPLTLKQVAARLKISAGAAQVRLAKVLNRARIHAKEIL